MRFEVFRNEKIYDVGNFSSVGWPVGPPYLHSKFLLLIAWSNCFPFGDVSLDPQLGDLELKSPANRNRVPRSSKKFPNSVDSTLYLGGQYTEAIVKLRVVSTIRIAVY